MPEMRKARMAAIQDRTNLLIAAFPQFLQFYLRNPPFQKEGQLECHALIIKLRRAAGSIAGALRDSRFLTSLYDTPQAWGIGARGSKLVPFRRFSDALLAAEESIAALEGLTLDQAGLRLPQVTAGIWDLVEHLSIVENKAKLVAGTKTLHHLLPELVVPIDRQYTQAFFGWHGPEFQYEQHAFLELALKTFAQVARKASPQQYVGHGWNTSRTKVIDNAIVGTIVVAYHLQESAERAG